MRLALIALLAAPLALGACAQKRAPAPAPDVLTPARAAFGNYVEGFHGKPVADAIKAFGEPTSRRPASDGGEIVVWSRKGEAVADGRTIPQQCDVTAFLDPKGVISGAFAGGNILFCQDSFVPKPKPPEGLPPPPPAIGQ